MATRLDNDQDSIIDDSYASGRGSYNASNLSRNESTPFSDYDNENPAHDQTSNTASARNAESKPWVNKTTAPSQLPVSLKGKMKKKGPLGLVIAALGIGGFGFSALMTPALSIVHMKETLSGKFNDQLAALDIRSNKALAKKLGKNTTTGFCSKITLRCKYQTMSKRMVKKLEKEGFLLEGSKKKFGGRIRPTGLTIDNRTYSPSELNRELRKNPKLRANFNRVYNPKFMAFSDKVSNKVNTKLGISKKNTLKGATTKEGLTKKLRSRLSGEAAIKTNIKTVTDPDTQKTTYVDERGNPLSDAEAKKHVAGLESLESETKLRAELKGTGKTMAKSAIKGAALVTSLGAGAVDSLCTGYRLIRVVGFAAKYLGALQLIRYSHTFMNTADAIKAGDATPEQVAFVGDIITSTNAEGKSATDSYGYKYAAYGDTAGMPSVDGLENLEGGKAEVADETVRYVNGQLVSDNVMTSLISNTGSSPGTDSADDFCGFVKSGWGQATVFGAAIAGAVVAAFTTGLSVGWGAAAQIGAMASVNVAVAMLTPKLIDMASGTLVTGSENGNEAGNAITSGMGAYNAQVSQGRGLAALNKQDAIAYQNMTNEATSHYAAAERTELSPLDPTSKHTFVGSIVSKLSPYKNKISTVSGSVTGTIGLVKGSLSTIISPKAGAATANDFSQCSDAEYTALNLAADPFCNLRYGFSAASLNIDPLDVLDYMETGQYIDPMTGDPSSTDAGKEYAKYIKNCIERESSIGGYTEQNSDRGEGCIQGGSDAERNNFFRLYYVDKSIFEGMDDSDDDGSGESGGGTPSDDDSVTDNESGPLPDGTEIELAQSIVSSGNVADATGQLNQIIQGDRTNISKEILQVISKLAADNKFRISSMKRDTALSIGAGQKSMHLQGRAVDISGSAGVNGVSYGYNGHNATIQTFLNQAAAALPKNCSIGVPNQTYVNKTKPHAKAGCYVFVDKGSAPHIHLDIRTP